MSLVTLYEVLGGGRRHNLPLPEAEVLGQRPGNMFPKEGDVFPKWTGAGKSPIEYAERVSAALRMELGDTH
jgi:hypothetical protein